MKASLKFLSALLLFIFSNLISHAGPNDKILGRWYTTDKGAIVEIYDCAGKLCGKIVWLKEPNNEQGKPKTDIHNPDDKQHNTPVIGLNMLSGFKNSGDNQWEDGTIYDPKNGKTYSCKMTLNVDNLEVRGYIGISLFGRTEHWTRAK